jgi:hypothetical protein
MELGLENETFNGFVAGDIEKPLETVQGSLGGA